MEKIKLKKITDEHINQFLDSRNLYFNRSKMIRNAKIQRVKHYLWWFDNNREIFMLQINNNSKVYIWQQINLFNKKKFFIGGWHSDTKNINLYYVLWGFKNLNRINKKQKKNFTWLAVVKNNNNSVLQLTKLLKYKEIKNRNKYFKIIKKIFNVSNRKFKYLISETT